MNVEIRVIPHPDQRYDTAGDWWWEGDTLHIRVSQFPESPAKARYEFLVAIHEYVEAMLCKFQGVSEADVDAWDLGPGAAMEDPGNDPRAPYHQQHKEGLLIEKLMAQALKLRWDTYEKQFDQLPAWKPDPRAATNHAKEIHDEPQETA